MYALVKCSSTGEITAKSFITYPTASKSVIWGLCLNKIQFSAMKVLDWS